MKSIKGNLIGEGRFAASRKRWWQDKRLESSEPPCFQRFQFDSGLGKKDSTEETLSPRAFAMIYGDKSVAGHVGSLLRGLHEIATATASPASKAV